MRRLITTMITFVVLVTGFGGGLAASAQTAPDEDPGTYLQFRTTLCPTGYARDEYDFAADCADTPLEGVEFFLHGRVRGVGHGQSDVERRTTNADGTVLWDATAFTDAGDYPIALEAASLKNLGLEIVDYVISCTVEGDPDAEVPVADFGRGAAHVVVPEEVIAAEQDIECDWYNLPASEDPGGTVTLEAHACPAGYDGGAYSTDCTQPAADASYYAAFGPTGGSTTADFDDEGVAIIDTPSPSTALYLIVRQGGPPHGGAITGKIFCVDATGRAVPLDPWPDDDVRFTAIFGSLDVIAEEEMTCTVYIIPPADSESTSPPAGDDPPIVDADDQLSFTAAEWQGAYTGVDTSVYQRECVSLYGAASGSGTATLTFNLNTTPDPAKPSQITLTGLDDELAAANPLRIAVNDQMVFGGDLLFNDWDPERDEVAWQRATISFDPGILRAGENTITVSNLTDSANIRAPPYVLLAEAFVAVGLNSVG